MSRTKRTRWILSVFAATLIFGLCIGAIAHVSGRSEGEERSTGRESVLKWVPASATIAGHVKLRALADSPLSSLWRKSAEARTGLDAMNELKRRTGIDPLTDLESATFSVVEEAMPSPKAPPERWGVSFRGVVNGESLLQELRKHGEIAPVEYEGTRFHRFTDENGRHWALATADDGTLLVGAPEYLREMLDAGAGRSATGAREALFSSVEERRLTDETFWLVGGASTTIGRLLGSERTPEAPAVRSFAFSGRLDHDLILKAQGLASDTEAAQKLADVARGMTAIGRLKGSTDPTILRILESAWVERLDDRVEISLTVPHEAMRHWIEGTREQANPQ